MAGTIVIEIDSASNNDHQWEPTGTRLRGRFLPGRVNHTAGALPQELPEGIPGQQVHIDPDGKFARITDPLAAPEGAPLRAKLTELIVGKGGQLSFGEAERRYDGIHVGQWVGWAVRAVKAGLARLISGKLPDAVPDDCPRRTFATATTDPRDEQIRQLTALLISKLSEPEKKALGLK